MTVTLKELPGLIKKKEKKKNPISIRFLITSLDNKAERPSLLKII